METIFCHTAVLSSPVRKTVAARRPACRDGRNFLGHGLDGWSGNGMDYCVGRCNHPRGAKSSLFEGLRAFVWVSWIRDLPTLEKQNSRHVRGRLPAGASADFLRRRRLDPSHSSNSCSKCWSWARFDPRWAETTLYTNWTNEHTNPTAWRATRLAPGLFLNCHSHYEKVMVPHTNS
jgi:hypothetical protein